MKIIFIIIFNLLTYSVLAQDPQIEWQKTIGGNSYDKISSVKQTADKGYILGGGTGSYSNGGIDFYVVKLDSLGNINWDVNIGGTGGEAILSIKQTTDGGYICGGQSFSNISGDKTENSQGLTDYWIVKLDAWGIIQWQNTIGGSENDWLWSIQQTTDGGYICGGESYSSISGDKTENNNGPVFFRDFWVIKLDVNGFIQWQNTIGGNDDEELKSIQQTADGGFICGGSSWSNISGDKTENSIGSYDYWVVKLNSSGNIEWQNTIGGNLPDNLESIQQTIDGGYICGGYSWSNISGDKTENNKGMEDYWIVKLDSIGSIQWQNTIGGDSTDILTSIYQTSDRGYICGGYSDSNISGDKTENGFGMRDFWVVKVDSVGNLVWENTLGSSAEEHIYEIQQATDGGYICGGWTSPFTYSSTFSDGIVIKLNDSICLFNQISTTWSKNSVTCNGSNDGSIQLNVSGGTAPLIVSWDTNPVQTGSTIQNLNKGFYTATISDSYGCSSSQTIEIKEPLPIQVFAIPQHSNPPGTATGSINLLVTGGISPYSYNWTNGPITEDIFNLMPGVYIVQITDAHGCAEMLSVVVQ